MTYDLLSSQLNAGLPVYLDLYKYNGWDGRTGRTCSWILSLIPTVVGTLETGLARLGYRSGR